MVSCVHDVSSVHGGVVADKMAVMVKAGGESDGDSLRAEEGVHGAILPVTSRHAVRREESCTQLSTLMGGVYKDVTGW